MRQDLKMHLEVLPLKLIMQRILSKIKKLIPKEWFKEIQPFYHYSLALLGAIIYIFPGSKIKIVAITGTKGKTSTAEFVNTILEGAGKKTALAGTLRFKIGDESKPNLYKMTMPGRMFIQRFLRKAVNTGCEYAVIEISSEAVKQYRNKFIDINALIFTNLAPEHIESHGSYEKYVEAKLSIALDLEKSSKKNKVVIVNIDDKEGEKFLNVNVANKVIYSLNEAEDVILSEDFTKFTYKGVRMETSLPGQFNIYNVLGAIKFAESENIDLYTIKKALLKIKEIKGRTERIDEEQDFKVIVDYAHTPDSLKAIYETFSNSKIIGVLGNCGGGRDKWKRKEMAEIADRYCEKVILTDEDPYDDEPIKIVDDMARYFKNINTEIIMDRRDAIATAFKIAKKGNVVIITGKGSDPYIMRKNGEKEKWSDAEVAKEELKKSIFASQKSGKKN
jgi:UDP-N-acetylmuramoyl-L-alanyl-D-glutamate--2,6-diaminopimelate ligase